MSGPREKRDRAGRPGPVPGAGELPPRISSAQFEQLLADFRTLERPAPGRNETRDARAGADPAAAAEALARACVALASSVDNETLERRAFAGAVCDLAVLAARVQLALRCDGTDAFLLGLAGGQQVALPAAEIVDVVSGAEAQALEARGVPRYASESWWLGAAVPGQDRLWLLIEADGQCALLGLEAYRGTGAGTPRPAGGAWRGARGLRGTVRLDGLGTAFVPDLDVILAALRQGAWTS